MTAKNNDAKAELCRACPVSLACIAGRVCAVIPCRRCGRTTAHVGDLRETESETMVLLPDSTNSYEAWCSHTAARSDSGIHSFMSHAASGLHLPPGTTCSLCMISILSQRVRDREMRASPGPLPGQMTYEEWVTSGLQQQKSYSDISSEYLSQLQQSKNIPPADKPFGIPVRVCKDMPADTALIVDEKCGKLKGVFKGLLGKNKKP